MLQILVHITDEGEADGSGRVHLVSPEQRAFSARGENRGRSYQAKLSVSLLVLALGSTDGRRSPSESVGGAGREKPAGLRAGYQTDKGFL